MQIIERIRAVNGQTKLTVVDVEADKWFREHNIPLWKGVPTQFITRFTIPEDDIQEATESFQCQLQPDNDSGL
jgi:hypothetical protein